MPTLFSFGGIQIAKGRHFETRGNVGSQMIMGNSPTTDQADVGRICVRRLRAIGQIAESIESAGHIEFRDRGEQDCEGVRC